MSFIGCLLNGALWGFLRRWFGGLFPDETYKVLGNRGLQTTVMLLALLPVIYYKVAILYPMQSLLVNIIFASLITAWIQFQFWSRGHGGTFADMGRTVNPDVSRYDRWFKWPLDKIWDLLLYLKENYSFFAWLLQKWSGRRYGYTYDMTYHMIRYTLCMTVPAICLQSWIWIFIGLMSAPMYELNLRFYEKYKFKWMELSWIDRANKLTEIEYGFLFGFCILL